MQQRLEQANSVNASPAQSSSAGTSQRPLVSVCIANYNGEAIVGSCIRSVLNQVGGQAVEIIVHDDASNDRSLDIIRGFGGVRLIESPRNVGYCVSNNRMAAVANGQFLLLLNNDAELFPDALSELFEFARCADDRAILTLPQYDYRTGELIDRGAMLDLLLNPIPNLEPLRQDVLLVAGSCLWIPRELWQRIGGFPEFFGSVAEDLYLCLYARILRIPIRSLHTSGYRHRVGASLGGGRVAAGSLSTTYSRRAASERNKTFCMLLFYPLPVLALLIPLHLLLLFVEGSALCLSRRSTAPLHRIYFPVALEMLRHATALRARRGQIRRARQAGMREFMSAFSWRPQKLVLLTLHGFPEIR